MEAGVTDKLRDMEWVVSLLDYRAVKPKRPTTYKKRIPAKKLDLIDSYTMGR